MSIGYFTYNSYQDAEEVPIMPSAAEAEIENKPVNAALEALRHPKSSFSAAC